MKNLRPKQNQKPNQNKSGFALVEMLVAVFVLSLIVALAAGFQSDIFSLNRFIQTGLQNQSEAKKLVRPFANEVRSSTPSSLGAYPIAAASETSFSFYSDIDGDGLKERIRYFLDGTDFKKGTIKPTGSPLTYNSANENIIKVIHDIAPENIFSYYDSGYDGTSSSTPLSFPVTLADIRLIKVVLTIDSDPNNPPEGFDVTTQVSIRNLKDNL